MSMEIVGAENMMWNGSMDQSQLAWQQRAFADWKIWQKTLFNMSRSKRDNGKRSRSIKTPLMSNIQHQAAAMKAIQKKNVLSMKLDKNQGKLKTLN